MKPSDSTKPRPRRILVVGTTSAGKTTLARAIARRIELPHVEMDSLFWDANWTQAPLELFRERVSEALAGERWVADGNYSKVRDVSWERADMVVWLDYPLPLILVRLTLRTFKRIVLREVLWNGNRESLRSQFTRDSLFVWALTTHRRRRRDYEALLANPDYPHLELIRLRTPAAAKRWLEEL